MQVIEKLRFKTSESIFVSIVFESELSDVFVIQKDITKTISMLELQKSVFPESYDD